MKVIARDEARPRNGALRGQGRGEARPPLRGRPRRQPPVQSPLPLSAIRGAVRDLLRERNGEGHAALARLLARDYAADEVILCDSGTSALALAIRGVRERTGRSGPVALPAFSCYDVGAAAVSAAVPLVFYDLDPETLSPDPASFLAALRRGARCLVVSHLYGMPVDWGPLRAAADSYGAVLIEDAAQGQGASLEGRRLGTLGDVAVLSFGRGKGWTGGRGGAVLVRRMGGPLLDGGGRVKRPGWTEEASVLFSAAAHSLMSDPSRYWLPAAVPWLHLGRSTYHRPAPARSLTRVAAGMALRTHRLAEEAAEARRRVASWLSLTIAWRGVRPIRPVAASVAGYLRYPLLLGDGSRAFVRSAHGLGVESSYPLTLPELAPLAARLEQPVGLFPGARTLSRGLVTLPTHAGPTYCEMQELLGLLGRCDASPRHHPST